MNTTTNNEKRQLESTKSEKLSRAEICRQEKAAVKSEKKIMQRSRLYYSVMGTPGAHLKQMVNFLKTTSTHLSATICL